MQIADRVSLWGGKKSPLPPGARWVEYLESTGTQNIDTGLNSTTDRFCNFEIAFRKTTATKQYFAAPFGYMYGSSARYAMWGGTNTADTNLYVGVNGTNYVATQIDTAWHLFRLRNGVAVELDGVSTPIGQGTIRSNIGMTLFATNRASSGLGNLSFVAAQISMLKIWDTDEKLLRDFRPIAIGTTGYMLDLVSGEYLPYGNKGTGDFIVGSDAPAMTGGGYKRLCVKRSHRHSSRSSARFWHAAYLPRTWKEVA